MSNYKLIYTAIEVSKRSGVPMLFLSNPGYGKTTIINQYAKQNNYHVESLIGSSFDRSEILGYMVNTGKDRLEILQPQWFASIMDNKKKGIPSILFIDEISTAPQDVQGSLYRLIFERTIGNNQLLPSDTLILSAANYKNNLPSQFNITSPALNRFCLINLNDEPNTDSIIEEFTLSQPLESINFKNRTPNTDKIKSLVCSFFKSLFNNYKDSDASKGSLNINNTSLDDVYDNEPPIYNFISGRTMYFLEKIIEAIYSMQLDYRDSIVANIILGLIGNGTNNFTNESQKKIFRSIIIKSIIPLLNQLEFIKDDDTNIEVLDKDTISTIVSKLSLLVDIGTYTEDDIKMILDALYSKIKKEFLCNDENCRAESVLNVLEALVKEEPNNSYIQKVAQFKSDFHSLDILNTILTDNNIIYSFDLINILNRIKIDYSYYIEQL